MQTVSKEIKNNFKLHELRAYSSNSPVPYTVRLGALEKDAREFNVKFIDGFLGDAVTQIIVPAILHKILKQRSRYNAARYTVVFEHDGFINEYAIPDEVFISKELMINIVLVKINERHVLTTSPQRIKNNKKVLHVLLFKHYLFRQYFKSR